MSQLNFADLRIARGAAESIAEKLGYLALALSQAVAYMTARALSFIEYLQRLCEDVTRLISTPFSQYADGMFSCWKLSVQVLMESNPYAISLLRLCSFLSPEGVSKELLYRGLKSMDWLNNGIFLSHWACWLEEIANVPILPRQVSIG
jgi:hypothetical protein